MDSIQAAHHVRESEIADEPICDTISNDRSKRSFKIQFEAISVFEPADSQCAGLITAEAFETDECLFQEDAYRPVPIRDTICTPETQLSLGCRRHRMRGQS